MGHVDETARARVQRIAKAIGKVTSAEDDAGRWRDTATIYELTPLGWKERRHSKPHGEAIRRSIARALRGVMPKSRGWFATTTHQVALHITGRVSATLDRKIRKLALHERVRRLFERRTGGSHREGHEGCRDAVRSRKKGIS